MAQFRVHPCQVMKLEVSSNGADLGTTYIQIHDSPITPATGAIPVKMWPAAECAYKEFKNGELNLTKGCFVGLSSVPNSFTLAATTIGTVQAEFTEPDVPLSVTTASALAATSLDVWTDGNPHILQQIRINAGTIADTNTYAQVWVNDGGSNSAQLVGSLPLVASQLNIFSFGLPSHFIPQQFVAGVSCLNCTIKISKSSWGTSAPSDTYDLYADYTLPSAA